MDDITRAEVVERLTALERRLQERFDLLERLLALGFDETHDQLARRAAEDARFHAPSRAGASRVSRSGTALD